MCMITNSFYSKIRKSEKFLYDEVKIVQLDMFLKKILNYVSDASHNMFAGIMKKMLIAFFQKLSKIETCVSTSFVMKLKSALRFIFHQIEVISSNERLD